jgi:hypothetical protein
VKHIIRFGKQKELYSDQYGDYHNDTVWFVEILGKWKIPIQRQTKITNRSVEHEINP